MSRRIFWTFFSNTKLVWKLSLDFEPRNSSFWDLSDSFGRFVKIAFYVSIGNFEDQIFFYKNGFLPPCFWNSRGKIMELWLTFDRQGCHNSNLSAQRNFMTNNTYFENNRFLYKWLRSVTGNFLDVWRQSLAGLLKVHITRPDKFRAKTIVFT